jgi:hypothetical protein
MKETLVASTPLGAILRASGAPVIALALALPAAQTHTARDGTACGEVDVIARLAARRAARYRSASAP